jgi:rubrerythrin
MAAYQEYRDEEVSFILIDENLSEKGKLLRVKNHYKARLLGSGTSPQAIQFVEKEIREEILYEQKRIQTAFNNLSFSRNEANENLAMGNISLMREALGYALAEIATEITKSGNVAIPIKDQHEFNEAKKLGREVDDVKAIHSEQLEKARKFYDESKSWGMLLWGAFIAILIGTYVYMYSPVIMQMIQGIGQSGTDEARRTEKLVSGIAIVIGLIGWIAGLGILLHAGIRSLVYPIALVGFLIEWVSIRASLIKTQAYNGEAKKQAFRALLWAVSPSFLLLGLAGYYIFQPFSGRAQQPPPSSFQANALINLNRNNEPIRDAANANGNIIERLASNTPILILRPGDKKRWYEVQTQSGKTGWIDGYGFRLASSSEIASYSGGTNTNLNGNVLPPGVDANSNVNSNSSEVATATPLPNPFAEIQPTPIPTPPPIQDPNMTYRETRLRIHGIFKGKINRVCYYSIKYQNDDSFTAANETVKPLETPLRNVISSIDANLLNDLNNLIARYNDSLDSKFYLLDSDMDYLATKKYKLRGVEYAPKDAPERDVYADRGIEIIKAKQTQLVGMLEKIASASPRSSKQALITQYLDQLVREKQETDKKIKELQISHQESGY